MSKHTPLEKLNNSITKILDEGKIPKGLTQYNAHQLIYSYNCITENGSVSLFDETVKNYLEKLGFKSEAEGIGWKIWSEGE